MNASEQPKLTSLFPQPEGVPQLPSLTAIRSELPVLQCGFTYPVTRVRCKHLAIQGSNVCERHGAGAGTEVRAAAERRVEEYYAERVAELVPVALQTLEMIVTDPEDDAVGLRAVKEVLDRAGFVVVQKQQTNVNVSVHTQRVDDRIEELMSKGKNQDDVIDV